MSRDERSDSRHRPPDQADQGPEAHRFQDLWEEDLAGWKDLAPSRLFLTMLAALRSEALRSVADNLGEGREREAMQAIGGLRMIEFLEKSFSPPRKPLPDSEVDVNDPAAIRRPQ